MQSVPKESWINPKIRLRRSNLHGKGMFARKPIKEGEVVLIWGESYKGKRSEYTDDKKKAMSAKKNGKLVLQYDENLWSIEERGAGDDYFINHSCDSSLWFNDAFTLAVRQPIRAGEEVTLDYALFETDDYKSKWVCRCGSLNCRKVITGHDWQRPDVQQRYKGHFTPLINKQIAKRLQESL